MGPVTVRQYDISQKRLLQTYPSVSNRIWCSEASWQRGLVRLCFPSGSAPSKGRRTLTSNFGIIFSKNFLSETTKPSALKWIYGLLAFVKMTNARAPIVVDVRNRHEAAVSRNRAVVNHALSTDPAIDRNVFSPWMSNAAERRSRITNGSAFDSLPPYNCARTWTAMTPTLRCCNPKVDQSRTGSGNEDSRACVRDEIGLIGI